jgi:hypothetical protein
LEPKNLRFGGGAADTILNPAVLVVVLIAGILILVGPRKKALVSFLVASILIPMDQVLVIGGLHFQMLRVLALFGIARLVKEKVGRRKIFTGGINKIDGAVILLTVIIAINAVLLFQEFGVVIYQLGNLYTAFGVYFLLRFLIRDQRDILLMVRTLAYITPVIAIIMIYEQVTGHNPYALLGGAKAAFYATVMERAGRFRATGCFGHPILAGTFGAILMPLFVLLWQSGKSNRVVAAVGIVSATVITLTSNSSTPIFAYAGGALALCMWPIRNWMRFIRWGLVLMLVCLHLVMKAPVWHLIARIDVSGGSSSYHRFELVNQCIRHFGDWWLVGTKSTFEWGWDMWDTANQYISICDNSGLLPFILFLAIIVYGFKFLGKARMVAVDRRRQLFLWALGAALFANVVAFVGISYWDQTQVVWYGLLAAISAAVLTSPKRLSATVPPRMGSEAAVWAAENLDQPTPSASEQVSTGLRQLQLPHAFLTR